MRHLRILFVYQCLAHYRAGVFEELQRSAGFECTFAADTSNRDGSIPTIPVSALDNFHRLRNRWIGRALWQQGLISLLLTKRYDAVVFLGDASHLASWIGAAYCRALRIPVLFWTIGWHRPEKGMKRLIRIAFYRLANHLLLYGNDGKKLGASLGYPASRMTVIGNSCSSRASEMHSAGNRPDLGQVRRSGRSVVIAVVRLNPEKRLDLVIRAAKKLDDAGTPITIVFAGSGPEADTLLGLAHELNVDLVLVGAVHDPQAIKEIYEIGLVTVIPANAGLTAIQSLQHGRPVVTTDDPYRQMPEYESVKPGITGGLYRDGDVQSLADTIGGWIGKVRQDPSGVAERCRAEALENWSPSAHAAKILRAVGGVSGQIRRI